MAAVTVDDGRRAQHRKYLYGRTRDEAAKKLTEALKAVQDSLPLPSERTTVSGFAKDWLESIRPNIRPKTRESYGSTLRVHVVPRVGHIRLAKLTPLHLQRLYADLIGEGISPTSVHVYHRCVHTMLERAVRLGLVTRNVAQLVDPPRQVRRELPMVTPEQARTFLEVARGHRMEGLFVLAITTGARQGELLGLTWDNVDLDQGEIEIRRALQKVDGEFVLVEPKTNKSIRTVALTRMAVDSLRRHKVRQAEESLRLGLTWHNSFNLVFCTSVGTPLDKTNVTKRQLRPLLKRASLPARLRFHDLRHIAASLALGQGIPIPVVSEMLGHTDSATTLRVYAHAIPGAQRQVADAFEAILAS